MMPHTSPMSWMTMSMMSYTLLLMIMSNAHFTNKNKFILYNLAQKHEIKQMKWKW